MARRVAVGCRYFWWHVASYMHVYIYICVSSKLTPQTNAAWTYDGLGATPLPI